VELHILEKALRVIGNIGFVQGLVDNTVALQNSDSIDQRHDPRLFEIFLSPSP
jgi:hypothetical protein